MDLHSVQQALRSTICPYCYKQGALEAFLQCSTFDRECQAICTCRQCGNRLLLDLSEVPSGEAKIHIVCNLNSRTCCPEAA